MALDLSWVPNAHLDRRMVLQGFLTGGGTITRWQMPMNDDTIDTAILSSGFGANEGAILSPLINPTAGTDLYFPGNYTAGLVVVGRSYNMSVSLTRPYLRGDDGHVIDAEVQMNKLVCSHHETGEYDVRITSHNNTTRDKTFTPRGTTQIEEEGDFQVTIQGWAKNTVLHVRNTTPKPSTISGIEYLVNANPRSK